MWKTFLYFHAEYPAIFHIFIIRIIDKEL